MPASNSEQPTTPTSTSTTREVKVRVRAVPKLGTFAVLGAVVAAIFAAIASIVTPSSDGLSKGQAFGVLLLWSIPIGVAVFLALGLLLDWISRRRARLAVAVQEVIRQEMPAAPKAAPTSVPTLAPATAPTPDAPTSTPSTSSSPSPSQSEETAE